MIRRVVLLLASVLVLLAIVSCQFNKIGLIANLSVMDNDTVHPGFSINELRIDGREANFKDGIISCSYTWHGMRAGEVEVRFEAFGVPHRAMIDLTEADRQYATVHIDYRMYVTLHDDQMYSMNRFRPLGRAVPLAKYSLDNHQEAVRVISGNHLLIQDAVTDVKIEDRMATRVDLGPPQCSMWDDLPIGEYMLTYQYRDEERWAKIEILEPGGMLYVGRNGVLSYNDEWVTVLEEPDSSSIQPTLAKLRLAQSVQ